MEKNCRENNYIRKKTKAILEKYPVEKKDNLIQILNDVQVEFGYIPFEAQNEISKHLKIHESEIYGVITFYSRFTLEPHGKYNISVCMGTACYVKGSENILNRLKERLGIDVGETTKDGKFSIEEQRCIGACGLAPVFMVNNDVYANATTKMLDEVLDSLK